MIALQCQISGYWVQLSTAAHSGWWRLVYCPPEASILVQENPCRRTSASPFEFPYKRPCFAHRSQNWRSDTKNAEKKHNSCLSSKQDTIITWIRLWASSQGHIFLLWAPLLRHTVCKQDCFTGCMFWHLVPLGDTFSQTFERERVSYSYLYPNWVIFFVMA